MEKIKMTKLGKYITFDEAWELGLNLVKRGTVIRFRLYTGKKKVLDITG